MKKELKFTVWYNAEKICAIYTRVTCLHKIAHFFVQKARKMPLQFVVARCRITQDVVSWMTKDGISRGLIGWDGTCLLDAYSYIV